MTPLLVGAMALGLVACGDDPPGDDGIATLGGATDDAGDSSDDGESADAGPAGPRGIDETEFQDAMLEFAECMRDHGIDMPDPEFNGEGGVSVVVGAGEGDRGTIDPSSEEFQAADEACRPIMEDVAPDIEMTPEEEAEMRDRMLAFAECMRDHGIDMPDPQFGDGGEVTIGVGGPGGGGDARPVDDPEFEAALEECRPDDGFAVFGSGSSDTEDDE